MPYEHISSMLKVHLIVPYRNVTREGVNFFRFNFFSSFFLFTGKKLILSCSIVHVYTFNALYQHNIAIEISNQAPTLFSISDRFLNVDLSSTFLRKKWT
jgi:hypothetical protein